MTLKFVFHHFPDRDGNLQKKDFKRKGKKTRFHPRKKIRFKKEERKHAFDQGMERKKTRKRPRKKERKHANNQEKRKKP